MEARGDRRPSAEGGQRLPVGDASDSEEEEEFFDALASDEEAAADTRDGDPLGDAGDHLGDAGDETTSADADELNRPLPAEGLEEPSDPNKLNERTTASQEDAHSTDASTSSGSDSDEESTERQAVSQGPDVNTDTPASGGSPEKEEPHEGLKAEAEEGDDEGDGAEVIDEEALREVEEQMTEEEKAAKRQEAQKLKSDGNDLFKKEEFADAVYAYSQALRQCPLTYKKDRSIMYANRAACKVKQEHLDSAIEDCTKALELNPLYLKVVLRRAKAYELTDKLDDALKDYQRALELDPGCHEARAACMRLPDQIQERNEKLKEEMMSKLKDLGNLCLRPFGLSTDNFQLNQDPATGSYSVNFRQNPGTNGK